MKKKSVKLPFVTKKWKYFAIFACKRPKQLLSALTNVNVQTLSNQNSLVSSKTFSKNLRSEDAWPLIELTLCEKQKNQVTFVT